MTPTPTDHPLPASRPPEGEGSPRRRKISAAALFDGAQELTIDHGGEHYLLRITRQNKLILTK